MSRIAVFGASRGLGKALVEWIHTEEPGATLLLIARCETALKSLARSQDWLLPLDLTKDDALEKSLRVLKEFNPQKIFYVAGGGPFGLFAEKKWQDHLWALKLNLLFPTALLHALMADTETGLGLQQFMAVGSAIAGHRPDPKAATYAAAKHGLRGLITSVQAEKPRLDVRLYEPGYLDTTMLPANAWPRQQGLVTSVKEEARKLWQVSQTALS